MKKYLEFQDDKSYKFWKVEVTGNSHTVNYGKIGTAGTTKVKEFDSNEAAIKDATKQMNSKMKKGYKEQVTQSEKRVSKKLYITYNEEYKKKITLLDKVKRLVEEGNPEEVTDLSIGYWEDASSNSPKEALEYLTEHAGRFPRLERIYVGDMTYEECEVSWIIHGDLGPLLNAMPQLTELKIRGGCCLRLSNLKHPNLKRIEIVCGGLESKTLDDIANAELPELHKMLLYLGVENYGFSGSIDDIKPFMEKGRFPKLRYLGLMNSEITDEIAKEIAEAPVLEQLHTLDLSEGTFSDIGAEALLKSEKIKLLEELDLSHHYMTDKMRDKICKIGITVHAYSSQGAYVKEDERYPVVRE